MATEAECMMCDLNKPIWRSQRGMILVVLALTLAYMWTVAVVAIVKYGITIDMTTINVITAAVTGLSAWYTYSKGKVGGELATIVQDSKQS